MKVISYSLWGNDNRYIIPLIKNMNLAAELFPGWKVVVYISNSTREEIKNKLELMGADVYECGESPDTRGAFWRFQALGLPEVDVVIIRDADSMLTFRDKSMVEHWLNSDKDFYLCRDHPCHVRPITCGAWGVKGAGLQKIRRIAYYNIDYSNYGDDEKFLAQFVYLNHRKEFMVFSPFILYRGERNEKFLLPRKGRTDYIGRVDSDEILKEDLMMEDVWDIDNTVPLRRLLIPYSWSWRLVHWIARNIIKKKNVQKWRDFSKLGERK